MRWYKNNDAHSSLNHLTTPLLPPSSNLLQYLKNTVPPTPRLNMEMDLHNLQYMGTCVQLYSLRPRNSPLPSAFRLIYEGAIGHWSAQIDDISL
jgi:hypothetical protein